MAGILFLTDNLEFSSVTTHIIQLARFAPPGEELHVAALRSGPARVPLEGMANVKVHVLTHFASAAWTAPIALRRLWRELLPNVVHVWGKRSLKYLIAGGRPKCTVFFSDPRTAMPRTPPARWFFRTWLRLVDVYLATSGYEEHAFQCVLGGKMNTVRLAPLYATPSDAAQRSGSPRPPTVFCAGPLLAEKGYRQAIWAYDVLRHALPEVRLRIVGTGPARDRLQSFADAIGILRNVEFVGTVADIHDQLASADVVWVQSPVPRGRTLLLEAAAAGVPVVASDLGLFREFILDGKSAVLVRPGRQIDFCRPTRKLLLEKDEAKTIGQAARVAVLERYPVSQTVAEFFSTYRRFAA